MCIRDSSCNGNRIVLGPFRHMVLAIESSLRERE
jgi:hypothetical protein